MNFCERALVGHFTQLANITFAKYVLSLSDFEHLGANLFRAFFQDLYFLSIRSIRAEVRKTYTHIRPVYFIILLGLGFCVGPYDMEQKSYKSSPILNKQC